MRGHPILDRAAVHCEIAAACKRQVASDLHNTLGTLDLGLKTYHPKPYTELGNVPHSEEKLLEAAKYARTSTPATRVVTTDPSIYSRENMGYMGILL